VYIYPSTSFKNPNITYIYPDQCGDTNSNNPCICILNGQNQIKDAKYAKLSIVYIPVTLIICPV